MSVFVCIFTRAHVYVCECIFKFAYQVPQIVPLEILCIE